MYLFIFMYMSICLHIYLYYVIMCSTCMPGAHGGHKSGLELELQMVVSLMCVAGSKPGSSAVTENRVSAYSLELAID
jgi:hypothetical protein